MSMNNQEAFDTAVSFLFKQGCVSQDSLGMCLYRTKDGKKCAVGALIPDALYSPRIEGYTVHRLIDEYPGIYNLFIDVDYNLLRHMQSIHDKVPINMWREKFIRLAQNYELSTNKVMEAMVQ